ncbi:MAG: gamma carbonic anhydrase family protein [Chloroflexi bacterium]|nr:gamma carbonic anhydrase family protein [Chloroflexota bacterium]
MTLYPFRGRWPQLGEGAFVADGARLIGDVSLGEQSSVWFNAVLRADLAAISVGRSSNIQDNCTLHVDHHSPTVVGDQVTVGHGATLHGCTIEPLVLVGMGAVILSGAVVGSGSIVGAHSLITEHKVIPPRSLVLGSPGRVIRSVTDDELREILENVEHYVQMAGIYIGATVDPLQTLSRG